MKKTILLFAVISIIINANIYNQNIPNGGFENWTYMELFDNPDDWNTGNTQILLESDSAEVFTANKTEDSYSGNSALELISVMTSPPDEDTIFGYAICAGNIGGEGDTLIYTGGFPVTDNPDSLCGYFKYSNVPGDTSFLLCAFKKDGLVVLEEIFPISGEQSSFALTCFDTHADTLPVTIDSIVIAFSCSNFRDPKPGSSLIIDSLWFAGITDTIPNYDFEDWTAVAFDDPDEWTTTNFLYMAFGNDSVCAKKSTDSYSGMYALQLDNIYIDAIGEILSLATTSEDIFGDDGPEATVPINFNPGSLQGYYKYSSPESDSAMVSVLLRGYDVLVNEEYEMWQGIQLTDTADYSMFEIPLGMPAGVVISHAGIIIMPGQSALMGDTNIAGSVLHIDDLELTDPCEGQYTDLIPFEDTTICSGDDVVLDAGAGYVDYFWTTGENTQTVSVNSPDVYWTFVFTGSCVLMDSVVVDVETCGSGIDENYSQQSIKVYPNPGDGLMTVEMPVAENELITLYVFDVLGHEIYSDNIETNNTTFKFDISGLEPGIYYLKIDTGKSQYLHKLFIK
jgi:hypothetical protein